MAPKNLKIIVEKGKKDVEYYLEHVSITQFIEDIKYLIDELTVNKIIDEEELKD